MTAEQRRHFDEIHAKRKAEHAKKGERGKLGKDANHGHKGVGKNVEHGQKAEVGKTKNERGNRVSKQPERRNNAKAPKR